MAKAVLRALDVLTGIATAEQAVTYGRLEEACADIASATLARLVKFLTAEQLLCKNESGDYALGPRTVAFARTVLGESIARHELMRPIVRDLAEKTGESAAYYEQSRDRIVLLAKHEMPQSFHYIHEGARTGNLHWHMFSWAMAAFGGEEIRRLIISTERLKGKAVERLDADLKRTRADGCASGRETADVSISRAAAPVFRGEASPVGAIGVTILNARVPAKRMASLKKAVREAAVRAGDVIARHKA